jgi:hypothetical protein
LQVLKLIFIVGLILWYFNFGKKTAK